MVYVYGCSCYTWVHGMDLVDTDSSFHLVLCRVLRHQSLPHTLVHSPLHNLHIADTHHSFLLDVDNMMSCKCVVAVGHSRVETSHDTGHSGAC